MDSANEHDADEVFDRKLLTFYHTLIHPSFSSLICLVLCVYVAYAIDLVTSKVYDRRIVMHADFE